MVPGAEEQSTTFKVQADTKNQWSHLDIFALKMGHNSL